VSDPRWRIFCIEDDQDTCDLLAFIFGRADYEVIVANTAAEALPKVVAGNFDLCLVDNVLPDGSGIELCRRIRSVNPRTPIVFYSADTASLIIKEALSAGAQAYLMKPVDPVELVQTVTELLRQANQPQPGKTGT
jgi:two-component system, OmpR family, response regulator